MQRRFHLEEGQVLRMMSETSKGQLGRLFFYMKSKAKLEKIVKRKKPVVNTKYILIAWIEGLYVAAALLTLVTWKYIEDHSEDWSCE